MILSLVFLLKNNLFGDDHFLYLPSKVFNVFTGTPFSEDCLKSLIISLILLDIIQQNIQKKYSSKMKRLKLIIINSTV